MVRGIQNIYLDMWEEPNFVKDLVEFCIEPTIRYAKAAIEAGADLIWTSNPTASMTMISREYYEQFVTWSTKRFFDGIRAAGKEVLFHICGDWQDRVDLVVAEGPAIIHIDQMDLGEVKARYGSQVAIMGNVKTTKTLLVKTPAEVEQETLTILQKGKAGGGFLLAPDCLTPRDTPDENMRAMVEIGRVHGVYASPDPLTTG
jgi:uroporphyrinogen decarboxylase